MLERIILLRSTHREFVTHALESGNLVQRYDKLLLTRPGEDLIGKPVLPLPLREIDCPRITVGFRPLFEDRCDHDCIANHELILRGLGL